MVYLDEEENRSLTKWAEACKMNKSSYIRHLIMGYQPIEFPPLEYEEIMDQLRSLGVNMNQLAVKANTLGFIDEPEYYKNAKAVWNLEAKMTEQLVERLVPFREQLKQNGGKRR